MFGNTPDFIIDAWEDVDEFSGEIIFYRLVLGQDENIHLRWKTTPDEK